MFGVLLAGCAAMGRWAFWERDRYLNLRASKPFRDWLLEKLPPILENPHASHNAITGATFLLTCLYDNSLLRQLRQMPAPEGRVEMPGDLGEYASVLRSAVRHTAILAAFDEPRLGSALRKVLDGQSEPPIVAIAKLIGSEHQPTSEPKWARRAAIGLSLMPKGDMIARSIEANMIRGHALEGCVG
jgi:hypothetical protein